MLEQIKEIFGSNQFDPTSDIFPQIDVERLKKQLNLAKKGKQKGLSELPSSDSKALDSVENEIVVAVDQLRQQSINAFQDHKTVYRNRLSVFSTARTEIEASTKQAPAGFMADCREHETQLQEPTVRLEECTKWKIKFCEEHGIERACHHHQSSRIKWFFIGLVMVLIESILNGPLLAQRHELGLLGGGITALLISAANVVFSSIIGFYSRFTNHRNFFNKIFGFLLLLGWLIIILVFNFGVAHFRDGVVSNLSWEEAAREAVIKIQTPLELSSIESWLLILLGCLISLLALLKGYYADDPYPRYGNVERELDKARQNFTHYHTNALEELENTRDEIVADMKEAENFVRIRANEINDVLTGTKSLDEKFEEHLEHCDKITQQLLQIYRENNVEQRKTSKPSYFNKKFTFDKVQNDPLDISQLGNPREELKRIEKMVSTATKTIHKLWKQSIMNFPSAKEIENSVKNNYLFKDN